MKAFKYQSVCFLTNAYPDFDVSTRGIFIKRMANSLHRDGYRITVVTPKIYQKSCYVEETGGITVYRFPFFSGDKRLIEYEKIPYGRMMVYYLTGFVFTLYAVLKHQCDLIHVHWAIPTGLIGVLCATLLGKPFLVTIHGSDFRLATGNSRLLKRLLLWVCKRANHVTSVSEGMTKGLKEIAVPPEKISTFPMGVDERFFEAGRNRKHISSDRAFTILSNRNLLPIYNVSLFIRSIPMVLEKESKVKFLIAGDGPERESLEKQVEQLDVASFIRFLGRIPHGEMPNLLSDADIYVSTSLYDGTSVSLLEAMACGAFPIVTDIPSNREWVTDGKNGFLVPISNESFLAGKIVEAVHRGELLKRACEENREIAKKDADWEIIISKTAGIYKGLLGQSSLL
jgi:glycosyltransferase involved in cell wall biosynthesis